MAAIALLDIGDYVCSWLANNTLVYGPDELKFYHHDGFHIPLHEVLLVYIVPIERWDTYDMAHPETVCIIACLPRKIALPGPNPFQLQLYYSVVLPSSNNTI